MPSLNYVCCKHDANYAQTNKQTIWNSKYLGGNTSSYIHKIITKAKTERQPLLVRRKSRQLYFTANCKWTTNRGTLFLNANIKGNIKETNMWDVFMACLCIVSLCVLVPFLLHTTLTQTDVPSTTLWIEWRYIGI